MKTRFHVLLGFLLGLAACRAQAAVILNNLTPADYKSEFATSGTEVGVSVLIGRQPISLMSVQFPQAGAYGSVDGETLGVYGRNADGTVGSLQFARFTLAYDAASSVETASVSGAFVLQANTGYWFVLASNTVSDVTWNFTDSTSYRANSGVTLPGTDTSYSTQGFGPTYYSLSDGPQMVRVNGSALPAVVPEPSAWAAMGLALAVGAALHARRRPVAAA